MSKSAYCWHTQYGYKQLYRVTEDGDKKSFHLHRLSHELSPQDELPPSKRSEKHWALVLGPISFPETREYEEVPEDDSVEPESADGSGSARYPNPGTTDWTDRGKADYEP